MRTLAFLLPLLVSTLASAQSVAVLAELERIREGHFATSLECARCHSNAERATAMRDEKGREIAPFDLWQATMMANSARDPLWRAQVSIETATFPGSAAAIEAKCMRCHAPMAHTQLVMHGDPAPRMSLLQEDTSHAQLALDGVSCTLCHQIQRDGLGTPATFTGNYVIGHDEVIFGPHQDDLRPMPMFRFTGYEALYGEHIMDAGLCGSCHTLVTDTLGEDGEPTGHQLVEQSPYLEWVSSRFSREGSKLTCQDCHVPQSSEDGEPLLTRIVRNPGGRDFPFTRAREPYGRHLFVGGNTLIPSILRDHRDALNPIAPDEAFDAVIAATRKQLSTRTAAVEVEARREDGQLVADVTVLNLTGHKLPTGFPSRRLWIELVVADREGNTIAASGSFDGRGRLVGADGEPLASELPGNAPQPHRTEVTSSDEVQVYESVMQDSTGATTYVLLSGADYEKDNRLLPFGWDAETAARWDILPRGVEDENHAGGRDTTRYRFAVDDLETPLRVTARLHYQPLSARWMAEILRHDTPEVRELAGYLEDADTRPELVSEKTVEVK